MILNVDLSPLIVGLFCAGALSASMSTGDALMHAAASVTVEDGMRPFMKLSDAAQRRLIQFFVLVAGGLAYYFALEDDSSLVVLLLTSYGIICQLAPPIVAAMYWKRATTAGIIAGLIAGAATALFFFLTGYNGMELRPFGLHEGLLGLAVHIPVLIGVSLATRPQSEDHQTRFVNIKSEAS